jgi:hypothetical protein
MRAPSSRLSHCPTLLALGTMGQGTAESGETAWDKWDRRDGLARRLHLITDTIRLGELNGHVTLSRHA